MRIHNDRKRRSRAYPIRTHRIALIVAFFVPLFIALSGTQSAVAQTVYGAIVGTVTDSSGAVVSDAVIKATQTETNDTRTAVSNGSVYTLWTLPAGPILCPFRKRDSIHLRLETSIIIARAGCWCRPNRFASRRESAKDQ